MFKSKLLIKKQITFYVRKEQRLIEPNYICISKGVGLPIGNICYGRN
jgi:hypothetical protein